MNGPSDRLCAYCAEAIRPEAKICPHCRQWLTLRSLRNPVVLLLLHTVPLLLAWGALGAALLFGFERISNPKPYYSEYPHALRITQSVMHWASTQDGLRIFLTGVLTNESPVDWHSIEFDCRFYDHSGRLIDASNGRGYCTACARDETAFRIAVQPTAPTNEYASFGISVSTARNTRAWP